jgi:hypothetical protein
MVTKSVTKVAIKVNPAEKVAVAKKSEVVAPKLAKPSIKNPVTKDKAQSAAKLTPSKPATVKAAVTKSANNAPTPVKIKKTKLVRDSFTMPKDEYAVIDSLKLRAGKLGQSIKKSELLRAGIKALASLSDIGFKAALSNVPTLKTGRPQLVK